MHGVGFNTAIGSRIFYSYTDASAPSIADLNTLCTNVRTAWNTNLAGMLTSDGVLEAVIADDLASAAGNQGANRTTAAGTRAGHYFDQMQAVVINFRIGTRYRGGKPKVFLPFGIVTDAESGNLWTSAFQSALNTAWGNFTTALNGLVAGGITLGTQQAVSYFKGAQNNTSTSKWARRNVPAPRGTPVVSSVLSYSVSPIVSNQRRRAQR